MIMSSVRGIVFCLVWFGILFINSEVQWFSTEAIMFPKGHLAMSGDNCGCHTGEALPELTG